MVFNLIGSGDDGDAREPPSNELAGVFVSLGAVDPNGSNRGSGGGSTSDGIRDSRGDAFDPEQHIDPGKRNADGSFRRKRRGGPRASTGTKRKSSKGNVSLDNVETLLVGLHSMLAAFTGFEDINLSQPDESEPLAKAVIEVTALYDLPVISKEAIAWVGLIMVCGKVYGPKAALIKMELDRRKEEKKESAEVVPFFRSANVDPQAS